MSRRFKFSRSLKGFKRQSSGLPRRHGRRETEVADVVAIPAVADIEPVGIEAADADAVTVQLSDRVLAQVHDDTQAVAIDELQCFVVSIVEVCQELANRGMRVIAAGLDMGFHGEPLGPMPRLMVKAETVDKLHAICMSCGQLATRTQRLVDQRPPSYDDPIIMVGASDVYEARCRRWHQVPRKDDR